MVNHLSLTSSMLGHRTLYHRFQSRWLHYPLLQNMSKHSIDDHTPVLRSAAFLKTRKKQISVTAVIAFVEIGSSKAGVNICKNQTFGLVLTDSDGKSTSYLKDVFRTVSRRILRDSNEVNLNRVTI